MEKRWTHLEQEVHVIRETMATREDIQGLRVELHKSLSAQTWRMVTALIASMAVMTGLFTAIVKWL